MEEKKSFQKCIKVFLGLLVLNYGLVGILFLIMGESLTFEIIDEIEEGRVDIPLLIALLLPAVVGTLFYRTGNTVKRIIRGDLAALGIVFSYIVFFVMWEEIKKEGILAGFAILALLGLVATPVERIIVIIFPDD